MPCRTLICREIPVRANVSRTAQDTSARRGGRQRGPFPSQCFLDTPVDKGKGSVQDSVVTGGSRKQKEVSCCWSHTPQPDAILFSVNHRITLHGPIQNLRINVQEFQHMNKNDKAHGNENGQTGINRQDVKKGGTHLPQKGCDL